MPNYNTQGITSSAGGDPRNLGGSEGYGNPTATSSSGLMSSTSNATAKDDDKDEPGFFESIANLFSGAGADLPSDRSDDDGDSGASFYDGPMFAPYEGGSDDSAAASTGLPFSTTAADRAMYEALGVDVPEVYTGKMGEEEPEPNLDMDVLQKALQPEPITVEELEVKAGDTLSDIAVDKGVSLQSVIDANPQIKNPDLIFPGEKVAIPDPGFEGVPKLDVTSENAQIRLNNQSSGIMSPSKDVEVSAPMTAEAKDIVKTKIGIPSKMWDAYREAVAAIESGGKKNPYTVKGGANKHYDGKYQLGKVAKRDAAELLGITLGHTSQEREAYRNDPELQEKAFAAFTAKNHEYLMNKSDKYKRMPLKEKVAVLGYAHNQGWSGADNWLETGETGADAFGTKGTKYYDAIIDRLNP